MRCNQRGSHLHQSGLQEHGAETAASRGYVIYCVQLRTHRDSIQRRGTRMRPLNRSTMTTSEETRNPPPAPRRAEADCGDSGCGGRLAGQAPRVPRPARHPPPIHLPRHVRRPRHQSDGVGGWSDLASLLEAANYGTSKKAHLGSWAYPDPSDEQHHVLRRMVTLRVSISTLIWMRSDLTKHLVHRGQILFNRDQQQRTRRKDRRFPSERANGLRWLPSEGNSQ